MKRTTSLALWLGLLALAAGGAAEDGLSVERVTTVVPFPRGLAVVDGELYVLARGRVRGAGGVSAEVEDRAGTIFRVDPGVAEPITAPEVGPAVRDNGALFAAPTAPPLRLWDRSSRPPERDRWTDRPYCTLRYHDGTKSFYTCAFSGIDKPKLPGDPSFSKNLTDAILRYDLRTRRWYEVERHDLEAGGSYPHHDPRYSPPPHGWLNGPDNCLPLGRWLYAVAKDNSVLARYDLAALADDPEAGPAPSEVVLGDSVEVRGLGRQEYLGHSALAYRDSWLYLAYRTSSVIVRLPLDEGFEPVRPIVAELVARFDPWDPATGRSANLTDLDFDSAGRLYAVSAKPSRIFRFTPDPTKVFDGRSGGEAPWADLAALTGNPRMKSENLLFYEGNLFVTSGDGYAHQRGAAGTVYRVAVAD